MESNHCLLVNSQAHDLHATGHQNFLGPLVPFPVATMARPVSLSMRSGSGVGALIGIAGLEFISSNMRCVDGACCRTFGLFKITGCGVDVTSPILAMNLSLREDDILQVTSTSQSHCISVIQVCLPLDT